MKYLVWLGNPGSRYDRTRHNVWFMLCEALAERWGAPAFAKSDDRTLATAATVGGESVTILLPQTYMNLSGQSVAPILRYRRADPARDLLVISDDVSMPFGKLRFRETGSAGGHNGLKSLIECFGSQDFARLKIGIDHDTRVPLENWVLMKFSAQELDALEDDVFARATETVERWIASGKA